MNTKIILEMCYNHEGDIDKAKKMIDQAVRLGVWGVKFQKWHIDGFPYRIKRKLRKPINSFGDNYYDHRKHLEFSIDEIARLKEYAEERDLEFVCSGKDLHSMKQLAEIRVMNLKVPSQRYLHNALFKFTVNCKLTYGARIMVSTGMSNEKEIFSSKWQKWADVIMHCVSCYPAELKELDFAFMRNAKIYNGYSSHEVEGRGIKYAVALGAEWIERHYTLDKKGKGTDNKASSDIKEIKRIMKEVEEAEEVLGNGNRILNFEEEANRELYRSF